MEIEDIKKFLYKEAAAANPQMSAGNQAMALAAQMATPAGAPALPKPVQQQHPQPSPEQDPNQQISHEAELQGRLNEQDKIISGLRQEVEKSKIEAEKEKAKAYIANTQQKATNQIQQEYAKLDQRKAEMRAEEKAHRLQLIADSANQRAIVTENKAKKDIETTNAIADAKNKLVTDSAKKYVDTTNSIRKDIEAANKANASHLPISLTNQVNDASAAAKNALSVSQKWINKHASMQQYNQSAITSPNANKKENTVATSNLGAQNAAGNNTGVAKQTPTTSNSNYGSHQPAPKAPQNRDYLVHQQQRAREQNIHKRYDAQLINPIGESALDMRKSVIRAETMKNNYAKGTPEYNRWENARQFSNYQFNKRQSELNKLKSEGNAQAAEELARLKDFGQKQNRSGTIEFLDKAIQYANIPMMVGYGTGLLDRKTDTLANALGAYKSDEELFREAIAAGKDPSTFTYADAKKPGWFSPIYTALTSNKTPLGWISNYIVDPITGGVGNALLENERSSMMADNRGVSRNWWSNDYSTDAGKNFYRATQDRGIKHSLLGNYGSIAANTALAAASVMPTVGLGAGAARVALTAGGRPLATAGKALLAKNMANASGAAMRRAGVNMQRMGRSLGQFNKNVIGGYNASALGRAGNYALGGAFGGSMLGLAGAYVPGWQKLNYLNPYTYIGSNNYNNDINFYGLRSDGQVMDQNGNIYVFNGNDLQKAASLNDKMIKASSDLIVGAYSWNDPVLRSFKRNNLFNSSRLGSLLATADPFLSNATGGKIKLKPAVSFVGGKVNPINTAAIGSSLVDPTLVNNGRSALFNSIIDKQQALIHNR